MLARAAERGRIERDDELSGAGRRSLGVEKRGGVGRKIRAGEAGREQLDHQGERWLEYGASQVAESFRVARGVRSQLIGAASTMMATAGELAARSLDATKAWTTPITQAVANVANAAAPKI